MRRSFAVAGLVTLMLIGPGAGPAWAHADYEWRVRSMMGPGGEKLAVVLHYTDGIVGSDPVKLQVVDDAGKVIGETPYARDYVIVDAGDGTLLVFAVDMLALSFWTGWKLDRGTLTPLPAGACFGHAIVASLREHWLAYGFSAGLFAAALASFIRRARAAGRWLVNPGWLAGVAVFWFAAMFLHGNVSLLLIAGLTFVLLLAYLLWSLHEWHPRRPASSRPSPGGLASGQLESRGF